MTFQHWAGVSSYTSSFDLAETCVFVKQLLGPILCGLLLHRHPLFRSYGVNLPSSLTTLLPLALGFSPHLPVSVCGTGTLAYTRAFLASQHRGLPYYISVPYAQLNQRLGSAICKCPSGLRFGGYGISTVCASTTPCGLALAPGLPWADEPSPRNLRFSAIMIPT